MLKILFTVSLGLTLLAYFKKDSLPPPNQISNELMKEPRQAPSSASPFELQEKEITYTVKPQYEYELWGLVVSYHDPKEGFLPSIHKYIWKDFINVKDLCVVWGANILNDNYQKMHFSSGTWTCNYQTKDSQVWSQFAESKVSNNHLLVKDPKVRDAIARAAIGDQIHLRGYLSEYTSSLGGKRGTSTSRDDRGEGACETIFVETFEILKPANRLWRFLYTAGRWFLLGLIGFWLYENRLKT